MPAESAAAPDVSGAPAPSDASASEDQQPHQATEPQEPTRESVGARGLAMLDELGIPDEVQNLVLPKGTTKTTTNEEDESQSADQRPADARSQEAQGTKAGGEPQGQQKKAEGEGDEEDPPLTKEQQNAAPWALPRIHKATAQRNQARQEAAELRQEVQRLQQVSRVRPQPTEEDPLAHVVTAQDLVTAAQDVDEMLAFVDEHPDGVTDVPVGEDAQGNTITRDFSAKEIAKLKAEFGRRQRALPHKAQWVQQQMLHEQHARATLPDMFKEGTEENQAYRQIQQNVPELFARLPGADQWVGWGIMGREAAKAGVTIAELRGWLASRPKPKAGPGGEKVVNPKVAPFLRNQAAPAPGVPEPRTFSKASGGATRNGASEEDEAIKQFIEDGGDDAALERSIERQFSTTRERDAAFV